MVNRRKLFGLIALSFICSLLYMIFINSYIIELGIFLTFFFLVILTIYFFALFDAFCNIMNKYKLKFNIYFFLYLLFTLITISSFLIGVTIKVFMPTVIIVEVSFILTIIFMILSTIEENK